METKRSIKLGPAGNGQRHGSSKVLGVTSTKLHQSPFDNCASSIGTSSVNPRQGASDDAESKAQAERNETAATILATADPSPETIIDEECTQAPRYRPEKPELNKNTSTSLASHQGARVWCSERPILCRHEGENNNVVDIELPGFAPDEVEIFYDDLRLHLFAEKADNPERPRKSASNLRRITSSRQTKCQSHHLRHREWTTEGYSRARGPGRANQLTAR
ncbi:hypothetical protein BDN71DRAFT_222614 [Pleurotus eryngii]|uniref:SHSP domain-containing protein n=1 Tax=Pleurotus eryngii TaxID=5323 RepID=A0A9P5ZMA4_PLEER|nr:hypothetical protein BDN71DRAFT_222614 [Pleurotus eryngii]